MVLVSSELRDARAVALSAVSAVLLVSLVSWRVWRRRGHSRAPDEQSSAEPNTRTVGRHEATVQSEEVHSTAGKRSSAEQHEDRDHHRHHHHHHHHHKHAKSLSPGSQDSHSSHERDQHGETDRLLHPRAQTQPNYSGTSHSSHAYHADSEHSSRILLFHDTHDEPDSISHVHHGEGIESTGRTSSGSGHHSSNGNVPHHYHDSNSQPIVQSPGRVSSEGDELHERLRRHTISYLEENPDEWELGYEKYGLSPRPPEGPGMHYRELALQEARLRKNAFENSKKAFKMGRKAEAKQLSEQGKHHDENARRYNALAAQEIFSANNPQYFTPRRLSKCDLHGLHVEEAMAYARDHLVACRAARADKTMLIVGRGSHSQQGGSRIRPAILSMLSGTGGIVAGVHEKNEGCIVVDFAVGR